MKRFAVTTSALLATTLIAACSTSNDDETPANNAPETSASTEAQDKPLNYVALGDSYAAMGSRSAATTGPAPCVRSADNYPSVVLQEADVAGTDATCSGAQTEHVLADWNNRELIPAQVNSLRTDTDVVSLSIGGNDIDFSAIANCFGDAILNNRPTECEASLSGVTDASLSALPAKLDAVHDEIHRRSPNARVIVTGYFTMLTPDGACAVAGPISQSDKAWVKSVTGRLNDIVSRAASRHSAEFVLPGDTDQHTACADATDRYVDISGVETDSYPMHPTKLGQERMGEAVTAAISSNS